MKKYILLGISVVIILVVLGFLMFRFQTYASSPGITTQVGSDEFYRNRPTCYGLELLINRKEFNANWGGRSVCLGWLKAKVAAVYPSQPCNFQKNSCPITKERVVEFAHEKRAGYATTTDVRIFTDPKDGSWKWLYDRRITSCNQCPGGDYTESFEVDPLTGEISNIVSPICYTCGEGRLI